MYNFFTQLQYAVRTGRCPVCHKRPRAIWQDTGALRMTCGHPDCFAAWLPGKRTLRQNLDVFNNIPAPEEAVLDG